MPLFILLRTLRWQKKATGQKYFIVFIHHSTFILSPLQGNKTNQPPLFFVHITLKKMDHAHTVDVVQSICLFQDLYMVCSLTFRMCLVPFAFVFEKVNSIAFLLTSYLTLVGWLALFPPVNSTEYELFVKSQVRCMYHQFSASIPSQVFSENARDVSRTSLRCYNMPFRIGSCWKIILHNSCIGISLRAS